MSNTFYQGHYSVSNIQWKIIEPFLPSPKFGGRPALNSRTVFNAILWILGSGAAWRDLPEEYGNWNSIYHKFRNWIKAGVFEKIFQALVGNCKEYHLVEIDSTFCKVHQHAAGARKILGNQDIGNSRGGKTITPSTINPNMFFKNFMYDFKRRSNTKIHALVNEDFQLLRVLLSGGQIHDSECALKLLEDLNIEDKSILGDKAYTTNKIRTFISEHKAKACIPDKSNAVVTHESDKELYKARNIIERFFNRIKHYRHVATRYDKLSVCFLNFVLLATVMIKI